MSECFEFLLNAVLNLNDCIDGCLYALIIAFLKRLSRQSLIKSHAHHVIQHILIHFKWLLLWLVIFILRQEVSYTFILIIIFF